MPKSLTARVEAASVHRQAEPEFIMSIADQIAHYVCQTRFQDFDADVIERTKDLCLSSIGSAVLGSGMEVPRALSDYVRSLAGPAEAGVIGLSFATSGELAAMMNCNSSHCTEFEDVAWPEAQYTCCLIPAVFSLGQKLQSSGREVLQALIIGFEVAARPGMICSNGGAAARGFLSCANVGTIGVAAAASKLMGLGLDQVRDAVTLAASVGGGLVRQTGSAAHVLEAGFAARDGIMAASLAARGLGGNPTIMDGKAGYFDALAGQPSIAFDLGTGNDVRVMAVGQKKYPCCYLLQRQIDGVRGLVERHGMVADNVAEIRVEVNAAFPTIVKYPEPNDVEEARFSLPHVIGAALAGEPMDHRTFSAAKLYDPAIGAQRPKVKMIVHDEWGYNQLGEQDILTIRLANGEEYQAVCTIAHGDAADPLTREETIAKFVACTDGLLPPNIQRETIDFLAKLEDAPSVAPLLEKLTYVPAPVPQAA
jgi:2-methylcitrate dehydratase